MIKSILTTIFTLALWATVLAQSHFGKRQDLGTLSPGWYQGYLPYEVVNQSARDLRDVRILQITGKDTVEAPYVWMPNHNASQKIRVGYEAINKTSNKEGYYTTFELTSEQPITELELVTSLSNFDWKVTLEGSMNQEEWFTIVENQKLIRIRNEQVNFTHNTLHFPPAKYQYFRVQIQSEKDPRLQQCRLYFQKDNTVAYYTQEARFTEHSSSSNQQVFSLDLDGSKTINSIVFQFADTLPFYRSYTLFELVDSVKIKNGWHKNYRIIDSGTLSSIKENQFQFRSIKAEVLKLEIENYDNPPLSLTHVETSYPKPIVSTRIADNGAYQLYFDAPQLRAPKYDLAHFVQKENSYSTLTFGAIEKLNTTQDQDTPQPLMQSQWWLWGVLILIILTMAFAVFKMMMKTD